MKRVSLVLLAAITATVSAAPSPTSPMYSLTPIQNQLGPGPSLDLIDGKPALLFNAEDKHLTFKSGERNVVLDNDLGITGGSYTQLQGDKNTIHAMWWTHEKFKAIYFSRSTDGGKTFTKSSLVTDQSGVLPPYHLIESNGSLGMIYSDERTPRYNVYYNTSTDGGLTWGRPDMRLDTPPAKDLQSNNLEPQMAIIGQTQITLWRDAGQNKEGETQRIIMRNTTDFGKTWSTEKVIHTSKGVMHGLKLVASNDFFVLTFVDADNVKIMSANKSGMDWTSPESLPGLQTSSAGNINISQGKANELAIVLSAQPEKNPGIYSSTFNLTSNKWEIPATRIDPKTFDNTISISPTITTTTNGVVVAAWTDFRNIIPQIYIASSNDSGRTWSEAKNIGIDAKDFMATPNLVTKNDSTILGYQTYPNAKRDRLYYATTPVILDKNGLIKDLPKQKIYTDKQREFKLQTRVMKFWALREKADFAATYPYFDPAFRNAFSQEKFNQAQAQIAYKDAKWVGAKIEGNVAEAEIIVTLKVMDMELKGKKIEIPEQKEKSVKATWVWIKDDWYLVFKGFKDQTYLKY